jgi:hypothetical protein
MSSRDEKNHDSRISRGKRKEAEKSKSVMKGDGIQEEQNTTFRSFAMRALDLSISISVVLERSLTGTVLTVAAPEAP